MIEIHWVSYYPTQGDLMKIMQARCAPAVQYCAIALIACGSAKAVDFPETEPNESKAAATFVNGIDDGDMLSGITMGASPSPGDNSFDYFRVTNVLRPPDIYRHRLTITTLGGIGHAGQIRGLDQSGGVIGTTDTQIQVSNASTSPPRFNQWYGFGKGETFYYRVSGLPGTTRGYAAILSTDFVTPTPIAGPLSSGAITITSIGQGHSTDTEFWVYDADFNPISGYGNDEESVAGGGPGVTAQSLLTRNYLSGVYYLAVSDFNMCNNLASPADDDFRNGPVMDFPAMLVARTISPTPLNVSFTISDTAGHSYATPASKPGPYEVVWFTFTVTSGGGGCTCRGDLSGDSMISAADVPGFVAAMLNDTTEACADLNMDSNEDGRDIRPFVAAVMAGACP